MIEYADTSSYGTFDANEFGSLENVMWTLVVDGKASKTELEEYYTLDEALRLYSIICMRNDTRAIMEQDRRLEAEHGHSQRRH